MSEEPIESTSTPCPNCKRPILPRANWCAHCGQLQTPTTATNAQGSNGKINTAWIIATFMMPPLGCLGVCFIGSPVGTITFYAIGAIAWIAGFTMLIINSLRSR